MRRATVLCAIPVALAALACDNEHIDPFTGGEGTGGVGFAVAVTDDPALGDRDLIGTVTGTFRVALRNDAGVLVDLGASEDVEVALHHADTVRLAGLTRPAPDDYTAVQIRFEGVEVDVLAGSQVGDSTLTQNAVLDVGSAGSALVDVLVPVFDVGTTNVVEIVIDLNSEAWVTRENLADLIVSQADLANSVSAAVR